MLFVILLLLSFCNLHSMDQQLLPSVDLMDEKHREEPTHKYAKWDAKELITLCNLLSTKSAILDLSKMVVAAPSKTIKDYIAQETTTLGQNIKEAPTSVAREYLAILVATTIVAYKEFPQKYPQDTNPLRKNRIDYMNIIINSYITKLSVKPTS